MVWSLVEAGHRVLSLADGCRKALGMLGWKRTGELYALPLVG